MRIQEIQIDYNAVQTGNQCEVIGGGKFDGKVKQIPFTKTQGIKRIIELQDAEGIQILSAQFRIYDAKFEATGLVTENIIEENLLSHPYVLKAFERKLDRIENKGMSKVGQRISRKTASGKVMTAKEIREQDQEFAAEARVS